MNCSHCGLEVPKGLVEHQAEHQFCCAGCRIAFELIHEHGLDSYYGLRSRLDADTQPITSGDRAYAEYDDATFEDLYVRKEFAGLRAVELYLEGVHCAACVWLVEKLPSVLDGVAEVRLDLGRAVVRIVWSPETVHLSRIARFLHSIGYPSHPFRGAVTQDLARREDRSMLIRIGVAGLIAGNTMLLAFALYGGDFHGIAPEFQSLFHWLSFGLSLPAVGWCARPFFRGALGALRTRTLHMDLPIVIGILAAWVQSSSTTLTGKGEIYFDTLTALIFFLLVGRYLQRRQQRSAASATELLFAVTPSVARRVDDDLVTDVPIEAIKTGNLVVVRSGETVPADGSVVDGESAIDRSLLTGESEPVSVTPGDQVNAGTISMTG
ncbi:MAG: heavy metal translocating P-type ATPase, partial [bacterium]|nr:heavy metal translocating P-type ATPase [bacterium]